MKKEQLAKRIFELENELFRIRGNSEMDPASLDRYVYKLTANNDKSSLEAKVDDLEQSCKREKGQNELKATVKSFYKTPEGADMKVRLEQELTDIRTEWECNENQTISAIEDRLQQELGSHWKVKSYSKGYLELGIIDSEKSAPGNRVFHFGQDIQIRYDMRWGEQTFESSCGSCGSFSLEGGYTIGERAMFYVGIGKLYANQELVAFIKESMIESANEIERLRKKYNAVAKKIENPFGD